MSSNLLLAVASIPIVIIKPYHWSYIQSPTSSNDPMYAESRCFGLETDGAIVDPMVEEDT